MAIDTHYRELIYITAWQHCISLHLVSGIFFPEVPYKYSTTYQALAVLRWWDEISATSASIFSYLIRYLSHLSSIRYKGCGRQSTTFNSWVLSLVKCRWVSMGKQFGRHWTASLQVVHIAITCVHPESHRYWGEIRGSTVIWDKVFNLSQSKLRPLFGGYFSRILLGYSLVLGLSREQFGTFWNRLLQVGVRWWLRNDPEWSYP